MLKVENSSQHLYRIGISRRRFIGTQVQIRSNPGEHGIPLSFKFTRYRRHIPVH